MSDIPAHIPADEVPIYLLMGKLGCQNSLSAYTAIKQMLNELSQIKRNSYDAKAHEAAYP